MLSLTWNWQSRRLSIDWPFSSTPCLSLAFDTYPMSHDRNSQLFLSIFSAFLCRLGRLGKDQTHCFNHMTTLWTEHVR